VAGQFHRDWRSWTAGELQVGRALDALFYQAGKKATVVLIFRLTVTHELRRIFNFSFGFT
jgi:hypothetical protein